MNTQNNPTKGCPHCKYPTYDVIARSAMVRISGERIKYVHSSVYDQDSVCICQKCEQTFILSQLVDITEKDLNNEAA